MANGVGIAVPSQQLNLVDSLSTPYGLKELPPSLALKQQNINRRQHLANILLQRGIQPLQGQQAGRFYVPPHWSQGVSQLAQAGLGAYMTYKGSKDTEALGQENKDLLAQAVEDYRNQTADVPAVPPSQLASPGQAPPPPQDPQAAVMEAMAGQSGQAAPQESATDTLSRLLPPPGDQPTGPWTGPIAVPGDGRSPSGPMLPPVPPGTPPPETPPIPSYANMSEMSGQSLSPPPDPRAQVAQAIAPPQAPMPGAMPSPAPAPMQGPMSPGTPGRARTPEEKRQVILQTLLANEHPQAQEMGKMLLNQMQQTENMGALRDERIENRQTLHEEKQDALKASTEQKKLLTDIQQKQFEMTYENSSRQLDQQYQANQDRLNDARLSRADHTRLEEDQHRIERERLTLDKSKTEQGKVPPGYEKVEGGLQAIPGGPADVKKEAAFNQDTAILGQSTSNMDRLATAANEAMNHPGLAGITGIRGALPNIPGGAAADAQAKLNTLKSQVAFGVLQDMRNNSKTGGALGSVSDAEGKRLEANLSALENAQSVEQMRDSLQKIIDYSNTAKGRLQETFNLKHKGAAAPPGPTSAGPVPHAPYEDPADERAYQEYKKRERDKFLKEHH